MTLIILGEAELEFVESVAYYKSREPGLGLRFRDEVAAVVDWISRYPELPRLRREQGPTSPQVSFCWYKNV